MTGLSVDTADGTRLHCESWGAGPTLLFVHGWSLRSQMWEHQVAALVGAGLRCSPTNRRGHGRSDLPSSGYDADTLADDLAAVLEQLDLREVTLVGHSMGGGEIARCLVRHGRARARVTRAVLVSTATPFLGCTPDRPVGLTSPPAGHDLPGRRGSARGSLPSADERRARRSPAVRHTAAALA